MASPLSPNSFRLAFFIVIAFFRHATLSSLNDTAMNELFQQWTEKYHREYKDPSEKAYRYTVFKSNMDYIERFNKNSSRKYKLGINHFADLTINEINIGINNTQTWLPKQVEIVFKHTADSSSAPYSINWRLRGAVTPIKDQGRCGSCWVFTAVATIESINKIATGSLVSLSEQELMDCSPDNACQGGYASLAYDSVMKMGGLSLERSYPYTGVDRDRCGKRKASNTVVNIKGYKGVASMDEVALKHAVANQPVYATIIMGSREFNFFSGTGVFDGPCGTTSVHSVAVIGYGVESDGTKYWLVKNSWGADWGDGGYGKIARETGIAEGVCSIAIAPTYPIA